MVTVNGRNPTSTIRVFLVSGGSRTYISDWQMRIYHQKQGHQSCYQEKNTFDKENSRRHMSWRNCIHTLTITTEILETTRTNSREDSIKQMSDMYTIPRRTKSTDVPTAKEQSHNIAPFTNTDINYFGPL